MSPLAWVKHDGSNNPRYRHGESSKATLTKEYTTWLNIKNRCFKPTHSHYARYGGRGITMCDSWRNDFMVFLRDMGRAPGSRYSIDRIDPDGNYEAGNCRWATAIEQARNKSKRRGSG